MNLHFYKYQGAGNDFILLDNRGKNIKLTNQQVALLCNRHLGIGADGLMLLEEEAEYDFRMVYYNADGNESSMCGNGGRCITAFAHKLGLIGTETDFTAIDGVHNAVINTNGTISLHMQDVHEFSEFENYSILNTGSPHYVLWVDDVQEIDVFNKGREIRNQSAFQPKGINVNFVQKLNNGIWVRTYERGVEDETLSCGTGVTAAAIAATHKETGTFHTDIQTPGGILNVSFTKDSPGTAINVILTGPAVCVFEGDIAI